MNPQTATNATPSIETPTVLEKLIQTIYGHIDAFQAEIDKRVEGNQFPDMDEVAWLTKMIACADKLVKQNAPERHHKSIKAFIKYAGAGEPQLGKAMQAAYRDYVYEFGGPALPPAPSTSAPSTTAPALFPALDNAPALFPALEDAPALGIAPAPLTAFTEADFEKYKHLLVRAKLSETEDFTTEFNGTQHNMKWVQYNLFQFCKQPTQRRFHLNEETYLQNYDHLYISSEIDRLIGEGKIRLQR